MPSIQEGAAGSCVQRVWKNAYFSRIRLDTGNGVPSPARMRDQRIPVIVQTGSLAVHLVLMEAPFILQGPFLFFFKLVGIVFMHIGV